MSLAVDFDQANGLNWEALCGFPVESLETVSGGRNSLVLRLKLQTGRELIGKRYFRHPEDPRDRLDVEVSALRLLREHSVGPVPEVLGVDEDAGAVVMEYIPGSRITSAGLEDADQAAMFLGRLKELAFRGAGNAAGPASEAFFTPADVLGNVRSRLDRLYAAPRDCPLAQDLRLFLDQHLGPALARAENHCRQLADMDRALPLLGRTLSPSDFGFHNALRGVDGRLWFLDFEYFGWDDPAKTLCDLALHPHPLMVLPDEVRRRLISKSLAVLDINGDLRQRALALYPIFVIKWCCILLNEFLPVERQRRAFSRSGRANPNILEQQLAKAEQLLTQSEKKYERFRAYLA
jgi:hypothetical protein